MTSPYPTSLRYVYLISLLVLIFSCKQKGPNLNQSSNPQSNVDSQIKVVENNNQSNSSNITFELAKYNKLIDFFQNAICEAESEGNNFPNCIASLLYQITNKDEKSIISTALIEQDFILSKLDQYTLKEIWKDPQSTELQINKEGEYFKILTQYSEEFSHLSTYKTAIENSETFLQNFHKRIQDLDKEHFEDKRLQLIISVHYYMLNRSI